MGRAHLNTLRITVEIDTTKGGDERTFECAIGDRTDDPIESILDDVREFVESWIGGDS